MATDTGGFPVKIETRLQKFGPDGAQYEDAGQTYYQEADGTDVTDPARIAEIEALIKETSDEPDHRV